jgi:hypothetical protein
MKFTSRIPKKRDFSLLKGVQTDSKAQPASYSIGIVGRFEMIEQPVREADQSTPPSVQVNDSCNPFRVYNFITCT